MLKNVAGQKWRVFAFDRTDNSPKDGDAAQITATLQKDGGADIALTDTNPIGKGNGYYDFDITLAESNADSHELIPVSTTDDIQVVDSKTPTTISPLTRYPGPRGPGVYISGSASNTNTVLGKDGTFDNPVSTIAAATTIANAMKIAGVGRFYLIDAASIVLTQTYTGWEFVGIGHPESNSNTVDLGSQNVAECSFHNLYVTGQQASTTKILVSDGQLDIDDFSGAAHGCELGTALTVAGPGSNSTLYNCLPREGQSGVVKFAGITASTLITGYSGELELRDMTIGCVADIYGSGILVIEASCTDGTINLYGDWQVVDKAGGAVALVTFIAGIGYNPFG